MADPRSTQILPSKGMNKDISPWLLPSDGGNYTHARNLINMSNTGDTLTLSTEPATFECVTLPYPLIGSVALDGNQWMVFLTDNTSSEIGIVDLDQCTYTKFSNTPCLNFNTASLITGASRRNFDCGFNVYWSDGGRNPDRYVNTNPTDPNNNIWIQTCTTSAGCTTCINTDVLNCDNIRIAPLMSIPCVNLSKSSHAGTLLNGTYQVAVAYMVNGVKCTDYVILSNPISLFSHTNQAGALTVNITGADRVHFKEMLVTIISFVNHQLTAKRLGVYDTDQETIPIDNIDLTLPAENIANIPLQTTLIEKSDSIWNVNTYLLRNGIYEKPDFNYQPLANQIDTKWVLVEYGEEYYHKGGDEDGMNVGYLRDEIYSFFIRWVYNTGDKSASYHIPGRGYDPAIDAPWRTTNTGYITSLGGGTLGNGNIVAKGRMSYWESTERYPNKQASVWDSNVFGHPEWNLCGDPIRHHRFPDQTISPYLTHFTSSHSIRILGVEFSNIKSPLDNNGLPITNIVGYEILRGSREGNKSIVAKGMINNMRVYNDYPFTPPGVNKGLYQNYPYNDLHYDMFLTTSQTVGTVGGTIDDFQNNQTTKYRKDIVSFHSPDTVFSAPYLGTGNLKIYQTLIGTSTGYFEIPYKHPKFKLLNKLASQVSTAVGLLAVLGSLASAAGGINFKFAATEKSPFDIPFGLDIASPDGPVGAIGTTAYALQIAYNLAATSALSVVTLKGIQEKMLDVITGLIPAKQYARQYNSTGYYNDFTMSNLLAGILNYQYIKGYIQSFGDGTETFEVNNLFRNDYVLLKLDRELPDPTLSTGELELSKWTLNQVDTTLFPDPYKFGPYVGDATGILATREPNLCSYYSAYKINFPNQYGQIGAVRQLPITSCVYPKNILSNAAGLSISSSPVLFGGDTYINRFTEKNPFFYFNDWLVGVDEDFPYDYTSYENVPYPRYWINNTKIYYDFWNDVTDNYHLDEWSPGPALSFWVQNGFFYLFNNGVRDFYVESDVNVGYRNWGEELNKHFYDPYGYTDIAYMFRSDLIKTDIYYDYDYSLSVSKFYTQYVSFSQVLPRTYDPTLAYTCYQYYPRRVAYSLPQTEELRADNWRQFLANNYYDFYTQVTACKSTSSTGALFIMKEQSPVKFEGVQTFQGGEAGATAITVGDGGLFNQPLQNIINSDKGLGYGNSTSKYAILSTPHGTYYVSQREGKIFNYSSQYRQNAVVPLEEISALGMHQWFQMYLPSRLLQQFPNYPYSDNPVMGVGITMCYDEIYEILYISKRDFKVKPQYINKVQFINNQFYYDTGFNEVLIDFSDSYFEDCSWTVSFSCSQKCWLSYHDFKPSWMITGRNHPTTLKNNKLYKHNTFTGFYGTYYDQPPSPIEIEYPINTQAITTTLRNVETYLESYYYKSTGNGVDRNQLADHYWTKAIISNNEQISGILNLNPKTNPYSDLAYPIIGSNSISILYSNKENIYRFNQFWDITKDRQNLTQMWSTNENGYTKSINPLYVDYTKSSTQLKKFRNYNNTIFLQKLYTGTNNIQMNLRLDKTKNQVSPR